MRTTIFFAAGLMAALAMGCGKAAAKKGTADAESAQTAASATPGAVAAAPVSPGATTAVSGAGVALTTPGLADACTYKDGAAGNGCFTCTPRDIPIVQCTPVTGSFDPATMCTHDADDMKCNVGSGSDFDFNLDQTSKGEQVYNDIPLLVIGAKALISSNLPDPATKTMCDGLLDALGTYKKELFSGGDPGPFMDAVTALVKVDQPGIPDSELASLRASGTAAFTAIDAKKNAGTVSDGDVINIAAQLLGAMPASITAKLTGKVDLPSILANLSSSAGNNQLNSLLSVLGGGGGGNILSQISGGETTGSSTSTGTGTGI